MKDSARHASRLDGRAGHLDASDTAATDGWRAVSKRRLDELTARSLGWDGYNGLPVSGATALFALEMLSTICDDATLAPQIVPGPDGDLQVEWHTLIGDVELHVVKPHQVDAWYSLAADEGDGISARLSNNFGVLAEWVKNITETAGGTEPATT